MDLTNATITQVAKLFGVAFKLGATDIMQEYPIRTELEICQTLGLTHWRKLHAKGLANAYYVGRQHIEYMDKE